MVDDSRIRKFQEFLAKDPRDPMLHYGLGNELSKSGRFADAVESFEEAIRVNPNYTAAYRQLGKSLEKLGARTRPDVPMKMVSPWVSRPEICRP